VTKVLVIGGTRFLGPAVVRRLTAAGHEVAVAHSGAHEHPEVEDVRHLHGGRAALLDSGGAIERWHPDVLVDTFPGGATAEKAHQLAACATRTDARIIAISSVDVYQHGVDSGMADGSGMATLSVDPIPLTEDARRRVRPYPGGTPTHDNVAMEDTLEAAGRAATLLRPGAIYGPHPSTREWNLVRRVAVGDHDLPLPDGGVQLFHRVALDCVAVAIVAAVERPRDNLWACNVVDPFDWDHSGLARRIGELLDWEWEPRRVPFGEDVHPWQTGHPMLAADRRLREDLGVGPGEPDPDDALRETVEWLWEHHEEMLAGEVDAQDTGAHG
jgi:nucleoside-diphosphate-sugar epimerase